MNRERGLQIYHEQGLRSGVQANSGLGYQTEIRPEKLWGRGEEQLQLESQWAFAGSETWNNDKSSSKDTISG